MNELLEGFRFGLGFCGAVATCAALAVGGLIWWAAGE